MFKRMIALASGLCFMPIVQAATGPSLPLAQTPPQAASKTGKSATAPSNKTAPPSKPKPPLHDPQALRFIDVAGFGEVTVYKPAGEARGLALFASGDGGWNLGVLDMAHTAVSLGYWVAGFSTPAFIKELDNSDADCSNPSGLLDKLADSLKTELNIPSEFKPILIGYSSGATVVYAALAQAGDERFGGGVSLGFCPDLIVHTPLCEGAGLTAKPAGQLGVVFQTVPKLPQPWIVLQGEIDQVCNPPATVAFGASVKGTQVISLPHVGHGFSVPRNWISQYRQGLIDLQNTASPPQGTAQSKRSGNAPF